MEFLCWRTSGKIACTPTPTDFIYNTGSSNTFITYPQPFTNKITISLKNKIIKNVTFINSAGILSEYRQGINSSEIQMGESLSTGLYMVIIKSETAVYTTKVIKN